MSSTIWSRGDLQNILLALYASKAASLEGTPVPDDPDEAEKARMYGWGCRVAVQSVMLALGMPVHLLDPSAAPVKAIDAGSAVTTEHWWLEDIENVICGIYRSVISVPVRGTDHPYLSLYRQGFSDVIEALLCAIGSQEDTQHWLEQTLANAGRHWDYPSKESPLRLVGGLPEEAGNSPD